MSKEPLTVKEMDDNIRAAVRHAMNELPSEKQEWLQKKMQEWLWRPDKVEKQNVET